MRWVGLSLLIWSPWPAVAAEPRIVLAVHGGAGALPRVEMNAERETGLRSDMRHAFEYGHEVLEAGSSALDTVTAVVVVLEDSPWFNAGRGAAAALTTIKNPILAPAR